MSDFIDELKRIAVKEVEALTPMEISFLRARVSYLKPETKAKFKSVLTDEINLLDLKRPELDAMAIELGLNPEDYQNKKLIAEAIKATEETK